MYTLDDLRKQVSGNLASKQESRAVITGLLLAIFMLGMALRLYQLDADSMWLDEITTAEQGQQDLLSAATDYMHTTHPRLVYVVTWFFVRVAGNSDFVLRAQAMLFGSLSILLIYEVGEILWTGRVGLLASFLLAVNAYHIHYSQEARSYALMVFLALLSLIFLSKALQKNKKRFWLAFICCTSLSLYNHYFAFLFLPAEVIFAAFVIAQNWSCHRGKKDHASECHPAGRLSVPAKQALMLCLSLAVVGLSYVPWLPALQGHVDWLTAPPWGAEATMSRFEASLSFLQRVLIDYSGTTGVALLLWVGIFVLGLAASGRKDIALVGSCVATAFLFVALVYGGYPSMPRYVLFILPLLLLVIARGVLSTSRFLERGMQAARGDRTRLLVAVSAFVVLFGISSVGSLTGYYASRKEEWRSAARYLGDNMQPGDIVVADGTRYGWGDSLRVERGLSYYLARHGTAAAPIFPVGRGLWGHLGDFAGSDSQVWGVLWYPGRLQATELVTVVHFHQVPVVRLRQRSGDTLEETVSMLHVLVDLLPAEADFDVHLALAEIYLRTGRSEQAGLELHMASQVKPDSPEASQDLADARAEWAELCCSIENIQHPLWRNLGGAVAFLGHDIHPRSIGAGGSLALTLWWQALGEMDRDYTVFIHVVDQDDRIWAQQDRVLQHGGYPTSTWLVGETVRDEYQLQLAPDTPPGEYAVKTGIYYWETGERLPVRDEKGQRATDDAVQLRVVPVAD